MKIELTGTANGKRWIFLELTRPDCLVNSFPPRGSVPGNGTELISCNNLRACSFFIASENFPCSFFLSSNNNRFMKRENLSLLKVRPLFSMNLQICCN